MDRNTDKIKKVNDDRIKKLKKQTLHLKALLKQYRENEKVFAENEKALQEIETGHFLLRWAMLPFHRGDQGRYLCRSRRLRGPSIELARRRWPRPSG